MIQPINPVGVGGETRPEEVNGRAVQLLERAVNKRWAVPVELRKKMVAIATQVMMTTEDDRTKAAMMKIVLLADKLNLEDEKRDDVQKHEHTITGMPSITFAEATPEDVRNHHDANGSRLALPDNTGTASSS